MKAFVVAWGISFSLLGCVGERVYVTAPRIECPAPAPRLLPALDVGAHMGGAKNVAVILEVVDSLVLDVLALEAVVRCYESQNAPAAGGE